MPVIQEPVAVTLDTILFATDFTSNSERAGEYATAIARRFGSTIELAHVFDPSVVSTYDDAIISLPVDTRRRVMEERLGLWQQTFLSAGVKTKLRLIDGHRPARDLLDAARKDHVDLIIAGTESKTGLERLLLGSTAEEIIRNAECPVLTVGPRASLGTTLPLSFRSIVYATDFSPQAAKGATFALAFAEDSGARLLCCYVADVEEEDPAIRAAKDAEFTRALKRMIPHSSYDWCNPECVVEHGNAEDAILGLAKRAHADLIVLGARKSTFWLNRVSRGLTPQILANATCPVLTIS